MFTLLTPSALLALLGLLVPVAIHLWNRRPGREVAVGSLRWLAAGANRRLRNLKPEQLWLLLLRASLLAVLAVALAGPVWRQVQPGGRGQVLVSAELIGTPAFTDLRPTIDSLRRRGYALRWLASGFPKMSRAALRADSLGQRDSARALAAVSSAGSGFLWARVQEAAGTFRGQPLYVVSSAALRGLQGSLLPLPANVTWQALPTAAADTWVQAAAMRGDSLRLLVGRSNETRTAFQLTSVVKPRPGALVRVGRLPALRFVNGATGSFLQPAGASASAVADSSSTAIPVRTEPLRVIIYFTADYASDARYLQAGLRAASAGLPVPLALTVTSARPEPATSADWLFWLADVPLPAAWRNAVNNGTRVWQEAAGPGKVDKARLAVVAADEVPATIFKRNEPTDSLASAFSRPLWVDGQGRPVLSRHPLGKGAVYQLATRLGQGWSDLADSPTLPARLLTLLQPDITDEIAPAATALGQTLAAHDQRALDPNQLRLAAKEKATMPLSVEKATPQGSRETDLRPWAVLAAGLLFALERLLARRRESQVLSAPL